MGFNLWLDIEDKSKLESYGPGYRYRLGIPPALSWVELSTYCFTLVLNIKYPIHQYLCVWAIHRFGLAHNKLGIPGNTGRRGL